MKCFEPRFAKLPLFRRGLGGGLILVLTILFSTNAFAQKTFVGSGGSGTQRDPYKISTAADLVELSDYVNSDTVSRHPQLAQAKEYNTYGKYFVMTNNVDMAGVQNFTPIGKGDYVTTVYIYDDYGRPIDQVTYYRSPVFCGNFDGGGFAIKNLSIIDASNRPVALFRNIRDASISNLILDKAYISAATNVYPSVATFVGNIPQYDITESVYMDNCMAINCTVKGQSSVYGFIPSGYGTVKNNNCHVINTILEGNTVYGFGSPNQITNSTVTHSLLLGSISIYGFGASNMFSDCSVSNCILSSEEAATIYGFGYATTGTIKNCYVQAVLENTNTSLSTNKSYLYGFGNVSGYPRIYQDPPPPLVASNLYAACEFKRATNYINESYAFASTFRYDNATVSNCYYLPESMPRFLGTSACGGVMEKSESALKAAGIVAHPGTQNNSLNFGQDTAAWKQDFSPYPINKGYPILKWQEQQFYASTYHVTELTSVSATLHGLAFANGEGIISEQGFQYRVKGTGNWTTVSATDEERFNISTPLAGLTQGTTYEYFVYMKTATSLTLYGDTVEFTTLLIAPAVVTLAATGITGTTAILNGRVVEDDDEPVVERGFEWRRAGDNWTSVLATGTENISYSLTGLLTKMQYEFRAYIKTDVSTIYGAILNFTTGSTKVTDMAQDTGIKVYPNPAGDKLHLQGYDLQEDAEYVIYSVVGQVVMRGTLQNETTDINVELLPSGMYFLKIGNQTARFVKE